MTSEELALGAEIQKAVTCYRLAYRDAQCAFEVWRALIISRDGHIRQLFPWHHRLRWRIAVWLAPRGWL